MFIPISKPWIGNKEIKQVVAVLKSGNIAQGTKVEKLEKEFAKYCNVKYAVATNNGTSALHTALYAVGIKPGDEVITSPFTFVATANSILMTGAVPIFVDIDDQTFNIDPSKIKNAITKKTKAILVVNLFGQPADYTEIRKIARKNNLTIIEDAAQSVGASYKNKKSGGLGDINCFSFYATKNITSAEGGMITTSNKKYADRCRLFRNHGQTKKYEYQDLGYNYRLSDVLAVILLEQLKKLDKFNKIRQKIAKKYNDALKDIDGLIIPKIVQNRTHVFYLYTMKVARNFKLSRNQLKEYLNKKGIGANIYYSKSLHLFKHFPKANQYNLAVAERVAKQVISLPIYPQLTEENINYIINTIKAI